MLITIRPSAFIAKGREVDYSKVLPYRSEGLFVKVTKKRVAAGVIRVAATLCPRVRKLVKPVDLNNGFDTDKFIVAVLRLDSTYRPTALAGEQIYKKKPIALSIINY